MKVTVHNRHLLPELSGADAFQSLIHQHDNWFEKVNRLYNSGSLDAYLDKPEQNRYRLTIYWKQNNNHLMVEGEGSDPNRLAEQLMARLRSRLLRQLIESRRSNRPAIVSDHLAQLEKLKQQDDRAHFNFLIKQLLPVIKGFVNRYLSVSKIKVKKRFSIDDLVDEIYLALYERFDERPKQPQEFSAWTLQVAQETISDFLNKMKSPEGTISVEELAIDDLKKMEEKFTAEADGDLVMQEELDDPSYVRPDMSAEILSDEALQEMPEEVEIDPVVREVLSEASEEERLAFQLFWLHELTENEIAKALRMQIDTVDEIIDSISTRILDKIKP